MVPVAGVEPARCCHQRILNPSRLPIPSHRQLLNFVNKHNAQDKKSVTATRKSEKQIKFGRKNLRLKRKSTRLFLPNVKCNSVEMSKWLRFQGNRGRLGKNSVEKVWVDFESVTSANSITPAYRISISYFRIFVNPCKLKIRGKQRGFCLLCKNAELPTCIISWKVV